MSQNLFHLCVVLALVGTVGFPAEGQKGQTTITGVMVARDGGLSGSATGTYSILHAGSIHRYRFEPPFNTEFQAESCVHVGAIWTLDVKAEPGYSQYRIVRVLCSGEVDTSIRGAVQKTDTYLKLLKGGLYEDAYRLLAATKRGKLIYSDFKKQTDNVNFGSYIGLSPSCLAVRKITPWLHPSKITISAEPPCQIDDRDGILIRMEFDLTLESRGEWVIVDSRTIP